jgi:hypothetical protein
MREVATLEPERVFEKLSSIEHGGDTQKKNHLIGPRGDSTVPAVTSENSTHQGRMTINKIVGNFTTGFITYYCIVIQSHL